MDEARLRVTGRVPRIDGREISYPEFRDRFLRANQPVLITGLMADWRACKDWVTPSQTPNLQFFSMHFGESRVQVAECSKREFTDQKRLDMTVSQFVDYWEHLEANTQQGNLTELLYLKDWHLLKEYPDYDPYTTPVLFADDWLNTYMEEYQIHIPGENSKVEVDDCCSDYRFVYMGPKGTWTPLHADVFRSYSWSGNVCGKKLWHLLPPSETHLLYDKYKRNMVYDIYANISLQEFPSFEKTCWLECAQEAGEILFVPSGWYHQVTNMEDTISINHNWFNACNLNWVWRLLSEDYEETRASIEDIQSIADDFEGLCQRNLAANSGMNYSDFFLFILRMLGLFLSTMSNHSFLFDMGDKQLEPHTKTSLLTMVSSLRDRLWQLLFNIISIMSVAKEMGSAAVFKWQEVWDDGDEGKFEQEKLLGGNRLCILYSGQNMINIDDVLALLSEGNKENTCFDEIQMFVRQLNAEGLCESASKNKLVGLHLAPKYIFEGLELESPSEDVTGDARNHYAVYLFRVDNTTVRVKIKTPNDLVQLIQFILDHLNAMKSSPDFAS